MEDEDEFIIDEDLVASGSEIDVDDLDELEGPEDDEEDDDAEFLAAVRPSSTKTSQKDVTDVPYTYPCPQSHQELAKIFCIDPCR